ncbi:MAG: phytanoyl-CoA dioxygenase family protein [Pirellulaceae bacterium]
MRLTDAQLCQFREDGFLIVPEFFSPGQLQPVIEWINQVVDDLAERLYTAGKIRDKHAGEGFYTRLTKLEAEFPGAAVLIHIHGVLGQPLADLWGSRELLDVIEQILGPEIAGHPVWNLRSKTPLNPLATVPWHQDTAYMAPGAEHTLQPTAWIPLIDANSVNGTLQVLRGGHRSGQVFRHRPEGTRGPQKSWYLRIADEDMPAGEIVTCEMPMGSLLLINQLIPHRSTENYSDKIRWSVDLRWQRPSECSGFEEIKECILMRTARDPHHQIDWTAWARRNRIADAMDQKAVDPFDTTVTGPWLHRWSTPEDAEA